MSKRTWLSVLGMGWCMVAAAHQTPQVASDAEQQAAAALQVQGPTENKGISAVQALGMMALSSQLDPAQSYQMRVRQITVEPGGVVAMHQHQQRPGAAYILAGEIYEHNGTDAPVLRKQGELVFERDGTVHWWENHSQQATTALVIDLIPETTP